MMDERHDGAGGEPPHGKDNSLAHVAWIVLAILALGMILSSLGDCTSNCVSDFVR